MIRERRSERSPPRQPGWPASLAGAAGSARTAFPGSGSRMHPAPRRARPARRAELAAWFRGCRHARGGASAAGSTPSATKPAPKIR